MAIVNSTPPYAAFYDDNGNPLSGGKVYTYTAGTLTPRSTYTDQGGLTANANPVVLDSAGRADIWLDNSAAYKFIVKTSADATIKTVDNIAPFNAASGLSVLGSIAANTIVGNNTGSTASPIALTATQAQANMINNLSVITPDSAADYVPFYDTSGTTAGKVLVRSLQTQVLLSAQTVSAAGTLSFTGFMSSTYRMYKIYLYDVYGASAAALWARFGAAASYISTATYNSALVGRDSAGNAETADNAGGTKIILSGASLQATSTQGGTWEITIYNPSHSSETRMTWNGSYKSDSLARYNSHVGAGMNTGITAFTDIQFLMASGNINATGLMYGIV